MSTTRVVGFVFLAVLGLTVAPIAGAAIVPATPDEMGDVDTQSQTVTNLAAETATSDADASVTDSDSDSDPDSDPDPGPGTSADSDSDSSTNPNTTVGDFVQSTAADAEHTVNDGLFDVTYDAADNESKAQLVEERTASFDDRLAELEAERAELRDRKEDLSPAAYQARLTRLTVEIASLNDSIERTKPKGVAAGHDPTRFETLQENASALAGPEVATTAQGLPGFTDHPGVGGGPPAHAGSDSHTQKPVQAESNSSTPSHENAAGDDARGQGNGQGEQHSGQGVGDSDAQRDVSPGQSGNHTDSGASDESGDASDSGANSSSGSGST
ncbi:uncharacterized protein Nmag_2293 [Natrialba magadii ATCC 43099]|uniref:Uncharacterized protein n=1 Tax=Natrialba magadii (strain ATCC 43099 / DSM 3394 / CCM 3739 / CIP 104546 / IAM 13178 / JCM 8861 / NBRC 102185 / NCIMB 2190 / MS3) TaxID=547559 RepID=D3SWX5_NATMM|nr:hypothetical protein [Natrialba magadii]ADD05857.1 uncharacterized protein Nmag_2293 [Natrialba magadii ATCC 43099]ELY30635.1 hypothetical protein C500_08947 [Natrialba magadii ATCC 43099]